MRRLPFELFTGKFLADNIVGSVLVFSLIFWIPFSILVHCVVSHQSLSDQMFYRNAEQLQIERLKKKKKVAIAILSVQDSFSRNLLVVCGQNSS